MEIINLTKKDIVLNKIKEEFEYLEYKLSFDKTNLQSYIGLNDSNINYSDSYLIDKNGLSKQLNWFLLKGENITVRCVNEYVIIEDDKTGDCKVFKLITNLFKKIYYNSKKIYKDNKTNCLSCVILYCLNINTYKLYNYFYEI